MWKIDAKINIYTKISMSYTNSDIEHVCKSGTTLWNSRKEGKEEMLEHQLHHIP
jgi:hypothetical protein